MAARGAVGAFLHARVGTHVYLFPDSSPHLCAVPAVPKKSSKKTAKAGADKAKKGPSAYNLFMKDELAKIKKTNKDLSHKDAFKQAAANWSKAKK
jgi:hypothetical protein